MRRRLADGSACALALLLCSTLAADAHAQTFGGPGRSPFARDYRVDMAIPESPALKLLDVETSTVLRPGLPTELTTILSHFLEDGDFRLPESLALELSPALLMAGPRLERASYQQQKLLYATRFSAATATAADSIGRDIAFGLRIGIVNEADLRLDDAFASDTTLQITPLLTRINQIHSAALERLGPPGQRQGPVVYTQAETDEIEELSDVIRQRWAERHWNARAIDVAIGVRASALDDQGTDTRITGFGAWATYGHGFGDWGQLLVGGRAGIDRAHDEDDYTQALGLGLRMYLGSNALKGFVELQNELREGASAELFINSGAEVRIADWIWGAGSLGFARDPDGGTRTKTSLKLNTSFPRL